MFRVLITYDDLRTELFKMDREQLKDLVQELHLMPAIKIIEANLI